MEKYLTILICIPVTWFLISLSIQIFKLIKTWLEFKLENIKETKLWD